MKKVYEPGEALYKACTAATMGYVTPWAHLVPLGKSAWATREKLYKEMMDCCSSDEQTDDSSGLPASLMD